MCLHSTSSFRSHGKQLGSGSDIEFHVCLCDSRILSPAAGAALDSRPQPGASVAWGGDGCQVLSGAARPAGSVRGAERWGLLARRQSGQRVSIVASTCEHLRGDGRVWGSGEARAVSASPIISLKCLDSYSAQYLPHFQDHHLSPPLHHRFLKSRARLPLQSMHKFRRLSPVWSTSISDKKFIPLRTPSPRVNTKIKYLKPSSTPISYNFLW